CLNQSDIATAERIGDNHVARCAGRELGSVYKDRFGIGAVADVGIRTCARIIENDGAGSESSRSHRLLYATKIGCAAACGGNEIDFKNLSGSGVLDVAVDGDSTVPGGRVGKGGEVEIVAGSCR